MDSDEEERRQYKELFIVDLRQAGQEEDPECVGVRINQKGREWKRFKVPDVNTIKDPLV